MVDAGGRIEAAPVDFQFAAAVATFGMMLSDSEHRGTASWSLVRDLALPAVAAAADRSEGDAGADLVPASEPEDDPVTRYRKQFLQLVDRAEALSSGTR